MKTMKYILPLVGLLLIAAGTALQGCGQDQQQGIDCPSGSYVAHYGDTITGADDVSYTGKSTLGAPYGGGTVRYPMVSFLITDEFNNAKNGVCVTAYTGGTGPSLGGPFWYSDDTFATVVTGVGPMQRRVLKSDPSGRVILYWSTDILPPGLPRIIATPGPPPTYTAGADQAGTSWIQINSGPLSKSWTVTWTVTGEPAQ